MKLLAQSIIPVNPTPYMHLGYLAAAGQQEKQWGCVSFVILSIIGYYAIHKLWRTHRIVGLAALSVFVLFGSFVCWRQFEIGHVKQSGVNTILIISQIDRRLFDKEEIPTDIHDIEKRWGLSSRAIRDDWSHELRIKKSVGKDETIYRVESAGKDGMFDTSDDIYSSIALGKNGGNHRKTNWR